MAIGDPMLPIARHGHGLTSIIPSSPRPCADDPMSDAITLKDFPFHSVDKLRYGDTDQQGHVNNAVFSTMLETGRVEFLHHQSGLLGQPGTAIVIARLVLDFRGEVHWPGEVRVGTRIGRIGRSSLSFDQAIFQHDACVATAETVVVQIDRQSRRATPFDADTLARLNALQAQG